MTMRCRYSRRLYLLKSQFHNPDYIDDSDLTFLENLISFHIDYVNNCSKPVDIDTLLLPEKYQPLFNKICKNYCLISDSILKTELYRKFDLEYRGEERHIRNIREQIISYLQQKKGHIFTNRRVEFFLKLAMTTKHDELKKLCKEMLFSIKSPRRPNLGKRKDFNNNKRTNLSFSDNNSPCLDKTDDLEPSFFRIEDRETLLLPYLKMDHPPCGFNYDKVSSMIAALYSEKDAVKNENGNAKYFKFVDLTTVIPSNNNRKQHKSMNLGINNGKEKPNFNPIYNVLNKSLNISTGQNNKLKILKHLRHSLPNPENGQQPRLTTLPPKMQPSAPLKISKQTNVNKPVLTDVKSVRPHLIPESNSSHTATLTKKTAKPNELKVATNDDVNLSASDRQLRYSRRHNSPPALMDRTAKSTKEDPIPYMHTTMFLADKNEIIEISDDDDDGKDNKKQSLKPDVQDIDKMIDLLIHRCPIDHDRHPTLLRDNQMRIELNGFLLFVNLAIRLSLRLALKASDERIFDSIFIASIIVGLNCSVSITAPATPAAAKGIVIDHLTAEDMHIAVSRLASVQVPVKDCSPSRHSLAGATTPPSKLHSILVSPDIARLATLAMGHVRGYHCSGALVAHAEAQ